MAKIFIPQAELHKALTELRQFSPRLYSNRIAVFESDDDGLAIYDTHLCGKKIQMKKTGTNNA